MIELQLVCVDGVTAVWQLRLVIGGRGELGDRGVYDLAARRQSEQQQNGTGCLYSA